MDKNQPDWNPAHSSLATGAGTAWSAGNTNKPIDYVMAPGKFTASYANQAWNALDGNPQPLDIGGGFDTQGAQRNQDRQAHQSERDASQANQWKTDANNLAASNAATAAETQRTNNAQADLQKNNSFEQAWLGAARRKSQPGGRAYGAFSGGI